MYRTLLGVLFCLLLAGCTTISRKIQTAANTTGSGYPAAQAREAELERPLFVSLSAYKSVQTRAHQRGDIAIAVAASGGGYRAANLTLGVLLGLEKMHGRGLKGNLLQEVDYFSSVSGGGFGVGYYLTQLHNHIDNQNDIVNFSLQQNVDAMLKQDGVVQNPLRADLTEYLFFGSDRGLELEKKINASLLTTNQGGLKLGDIFVPAHANQNVQLPYWTTNATIYQNAATLPFTPDVLTRYQVTGFYHDNTRYNLLGQFNQSRYAYDIPVAVGVTASASVPFALPTTTLLSNGCVTGQCTLQLLDGGLSDNLGVYTALSMLMQDKAKIKILLIIDAYKGSSQPYSKKMTPPESVSLFLRVVTASTDANRAHIKPNINLVARDLLCGRGTSNVVVVYLDLSHYPQAKKIGTRLSLSSSQQKLLLDIGQELIANNADIKSLLTQLNQGQVALGQCEQGKRKRA